MHERPCCRAADFRIRVAQQALEVRNGDGRIRPPLRQHLNGSGADGLVAVAQSLTQFSKRLRVAAEMPQAADRLSANSLVLAAKSGENDRSRGRPFAGVDCAKRSCGTNLHLEILVL